MGRIIGEDDVVFDFLNHPSTCFMSDQQKGLWASQEVCFPLAGKAACYKHFKADLVTALGHKYISTFDELAFCTREDEFAALWVCAESSSSAVPREVPALNVDQAVGKSKQKNTDIFLGLYFEPRLRLNVAVPSLCM